MNRLIIQIRRLAFLFLILAVLPAVLLRYIQYSGGISGLKFPFVLHAHSHVAMLGWVFTAVLALFIKTWFNDQAVLLRQLRILIAILTVSVIGMLITFPVQGYAFWSILFSTVHIFAQLGFTWLFFKQTENRNSIALYCARTALILQMVAALGALSVGPVSAAGYAGKPLYFMCIYFYLHFQYNGWMLFAILALIIHYANVNSEHSGQLKAVLIRLLIGVVLTYAGMAIWCTESYWVVLAAAAGAIIQLVAVIQLARILRFGILTWLKSLAIPLRILFASSLISLMIKCVLQLAAVVPSLNEWISHQRGIIVAYLHLVLLGFITTFLIGALQLGRRIVIKKFMAALLLLVAGFALTELILVITALFPQILSELNKALLLLILAVVQLAGFSFMVLRSSDTDHVQV